MHMYVRVVTCIIVIVLEHLDLITVHVVIISLFIVIRCKLVPDSLHA